MRKCAPIIWSSHYQIGRRSEFRVALVHGLEFVVKMPVGVDSC